MYIVKIYLHLKIVHTYIIKYIFKSIAKQKSKIIASRNFKERSNCVIISIKREMPIFVLVLYIFLPFYYQYNI